MSSQDRPAKSSSASSHAKKIWDKGWALTDKYIGEPSNKLVGKWGVREFV